MVFMGSLAAIRTVYSTSVHQEASPRIRSFLALEALLVFGIGAAAHFLFDAIGRWPPLAWLAPVNESLWEHIKMAFWPALAVGWILGARLPSVRHRVVCAAVSASISSLLIAPLFYTYTGILGHHHLAWDIAIFALAVGAGHWLAYRIAIGPAPATGSVATTVLLAAALGVALVVFTYAPPRMDVFRDSVTGEYGLTPTPEIGGQPGR
jgi:hypothetical protein